MRVLQPPGKVTWTNIEGKPSVFPSDWDQITGKPAAFPPSAHAVQHAQGQPDALTPTAIGAASTATVEGTSNKTYMRSVLASERPGAFKRVWAWGRGTAGQLGDNTATSHATPVRVLGPGGTGVLADIVAIAAGHYHSLGLKADGTVWAWGQNTYGQLGDNTTTQRNAPVQVLGPGGTGFLADIVAIAAGDYYSLALKNDGTVWAWGRNNLGQLGDNTTTDRATPVQVLGSGGTGTLTNIIAIVARAGYSLALSADGTVWAWGYNAYGQLGNNTTTNSSTPVQVLGPGGTGVLGNVMAIAAGHYHALALKSDGTVWAWGRNTEGELGDNTTTNRRTPVQVQGAADVIAVAAHALESLALKSDGTVWAWGYNANGQLGDNTTVNRLTPVQVLGPGGAGVLTDVIGIAAGVYFSIALKVDGTVWAWGTNTDGQLGDNTTTQRNTPVQVLGPGGTGVLTNVIAVEAGMFHSMARYLV